MYVRPTSVFLSPCTSSSQAFSVNTFRECIRDERPDHVTRNAQAARNNESKGVGKDRNSGGAENCQRFSQTEEIPYLFD